MSTVINGDTGVTGGVGQVTPLAGSFTTLSASGNVTGTGTSAFIAKSGGTLSTTGYAWVSFQDTTERGYVGYGQGDGTLSVGNFVGNVNVSVGGAVRGTFSSTGLSVAGALSASGNLLVGTTAEGPNWQTKLHLSTNSGVTRWEVGPYSNAANFIISASGGGVYLAGTSATSWSSVSDERLKYGLEPIGNAAQKVNSLRAVTGYYKADDTKTRKSFFIAQDVLAVLPEAVDASDPERFALAYTDVIPLLVAAFKELSAELTETKARLAALEAK